MRLLGRTFGRKVGGNMPAVALVCDAFMTFDGDEALNGFATKALQSKWPGLTLDRQAQVEGAMGFTGSEDEAKALLKDLLQRAVSTVGLERAQYDVEFLSVQIEMPPAKVWCMVAVRR